MITGKKSILIIEDSEALRSTLTVRLHSEGYAVDTANGGVEGFEKSTRHGCDLIILDIVLPDCNGLALLHDLRQAGIAAPVLILSARSEMADRVSALRLGADDYVTKPFNAAELVARIEARLRRLPIRSERVIDQFDPIAVDVLAAEVTGERHSMYRARRGSQMHRHLIEILKAAWGYTTGAMARTIDRHISGLRERSQANPKCAKPILSVAKVGYKFAGSKNT